MSAGLRGKPQEEPADRGDGAAGLLDGPADSTARGQDGRSARAQRTRRIIADAHIALINDGELKPSAKQITERAGVSQRALWDNFKDMDSVMANTAQRLLTEQDASFVPISADLALAERIERYCLQRCAMLESVAQLSTAADAQRPFSPVLQRNQVVNLQRIQDEVERLFETELSRLCTGDRARITRALCTVSHWANWQLLRTYLGQSAAEARAVLEVTVTALLQGAERFQHAAPPENLHHNEKRKSL